MSFTFQSIEIILAIQKYNSISKAAQYLYISEPALSKQIKRIENDLGYPLIIRTSTGCSLTKAGILLAEKGIEILKLRDILLNEMSDAMNTQCKTIRFGLANCYSETLLTEFLPTFINKCPNTNVDIIINKTDVLEELCIDGKVDIILTQKEYCDPRLETVDVVKEKVVAYLPQKFKEIDELKPYFEKESIPLKILEKYPYAEGQGHRRFEYFINKFYEEIEFNPNIIFKSESWSTILSLIQNQTCYGIMPDIFHAYNDVYKLDIESNFPTERTLCLAYQYRTKLPKEWISFIESVKNINK